MKDFEFRASTDIGGDGFTYFTVKLSEKDASLLERICLDKEVVAAGFYNCKELEKLYNKVYPKAVKAVTEELIESGEVDLEELEEEARDNGDIDEDEEYVFAADELYSITVHFPESFV